MVENMYERSGRVSVCLASYNGETFIREQVESILGQLGPADEIIIADDGSTDCTISVIEAFADSRIVVLRSQGRAGIVANFERALVVASGDFVFLSDQDDIWLPDKVDESLRAMRSSDLIVSDCVMVDGNNNTIHDSFFLVRSSGPGVCKNIFKNTYLGCCMAFRREVLLAALPFPPGLNMHDEWIGLVGQALFRVEFLTTRLIRYRRHGGNASPELNASGFGWSARLRIRAHKGFWLFCRWASWHLGVGTRARNQRPHER